MIKPESPSLQGGLFTAGPPGKSVAHNIFNTTVIIKAFKGNFIINFFCEEGNNEDVTTQLFIRNFTEARKMLEYPTSRFIFLHESVCLMIILSLSNIIYEKYYINTKEM